MAAKGEEYTGRVLKPSCDGRLLQSGHTSPGLGGLVRQHIMYNGMRQRTKHRAISIGRKVKESTWSLRQLDRTTSWLTQGSPPYTSGLYSWPSWHSAGQTHRQHERRSWDSALAEKCADEGRKLGWKAYSRNGGSMALRAPPVRNGTNMYLIDT